jgi:hypothetical protein
MYRRGILPALLVSRRLRCGHHGTQPGRSDLFRLHG